MGHDAAPFVVLGPSAPLLTVVSMDATERQRDEALAAVERARRAAGRWVASCDVRDECDEVERQRARRAKAALDELADRRHAAA